jgi:hypothetical protein
MTLGDFNPKSPKAVRSPIGMAKRRSLSRRMAVARLEVRGRRSTIVKAPN